MNRDLKDSTLYEEYYRVKERRSSVRFFALLVAIISVFLGIRYYWTSRFGGVMVDGSSMYSTLEHKEYLVVEYTKHRKAERGDVIVVHVEDYPEIQAENANKKEEYKLKYLIKRLIAVEGDTVKCEGGRMYIRYAGTQDFVEIDERAYAYYASSEAKAGYSFSEYTVGEGRVFFLGDNRCNSKDSRYREEQGSHLKNDLYKEEDIFGVVPNWAITHQETLQKLLFRGQK